VKGSDDEKRRMRRGRADAVNPPGILVNIKTVTANT